jgi:hypothetical protein
MTSGSGPLFSGPDVTGWQAVAVVDVAQPSQPNEPGGRGEDFGKSSPVGLVVLILFFVAVAFLVRSMTKHLKKVPASFEKEPASSEEPPAADPEAADTEAVDAEASQASAEEKK